MFSPMVKRLLTSCFGLGFLPIGPGTWGSIPVAVAFFFLCRHTDSPLAMVSVMGLFIVAGSIICITMSDAAIAATGRSDPPEVVADELAGQGLTFLSVCFGTINRIPDNRIWLVAVAGFLIFRALDVLKPWPAHDLEKLPKGWGILTDDLMAGVYAAVVLHVGVAVWIWATV